MTSDRPPIQFVKHAYFSEQAKAEWGSFMWSTPDGGEVEITRALGHDEDPEYDYTWPDKEYVGLVIKCLRRVSWGSRESIRDYPYTTVVIKCDGYTWTTTTI